MTEFYPLGDVLSVEERLEFGASKEQKYGNLGDGRNVRAAKTQEIREPKEGEWYLFGARPTAYRASADLADAYRIMRLTVTYTVETEIEEA